MVRIPNFGLDVLKIEPMLCVKSVCCRSALNASAVRSSGGVFSPVRIAEDFRRSGSSSSAIVVVQHPAQSLPPLDLASTVQASLGVDELVGQSLMIALSVIGGNEVLDGPSQ